MCLVLVFAGLIEYAAVNVLARQRLVVAPAPRPTAATRAANHLSSAGSSTASADGVQQGTSGDSTSASGTSGATRQQQVSFHNMTFWRLIATALSAPPPLGIVV